ncbi:MAG: rhodanese-like domain-containing protein [Mycobacterium sp.]
MSESVLSAATLHERLASTDVPRLIDVRTPAEFETAHLEGSYNVPLDLLREHRNEIAAHLDQEVVLICRSGQRANEAGEVLRRSGLANVWILGGGISAWESGGYGVIRGVQRWSLERQVRLVAGLIVAAGVAISPVLPGAQWVAGAIGVGLTVAALTDTCAMGMLLARLPYNRRGAGTCDVRTVVAQLVEATPPRGVHG